MDGRTGRGYEYKVCWEKTWLLESELENARELLRQFESKRQAQRGGKRGDWHVQTRTGKILGHVVPALLFVNFLGETRRNIGGRRKLIEMLHAIGRFELTGWQGEKRKARFALMTFPTISRARH